MLGRTDKKVIEVADDPRGTIGDYVWSPRGNYLAFSMRAGVRPMNEIYPLDRVSEAYDRMMSGKARFRVVLTIGD